ncbi:type II toxin-antitoxin system prevent-host-death family antitoxin [Brevundimonas sp. EYE_349]|nr:type II toxin-antitoxin system prevent-host-death family antitoxin [Brevundimonas sp. EYE_349]
MSMDQTVTASAANRHFSELLRQVEGGETVAVTRHGKVVARIVPADQEADARKAREAALKAYLARAAQRPVIDIGPWTRDELYER